MNINMDNIQLDPPTPGCDCFACELQRFVQSYINRGITPLPIAGALAEVSAEILQKITAQNAPQMHFGIEPTN